MKKLLGISLVAALAISPLMAHAEDFQPITPDTYNLLAHDAEDNAGGSGFAAPTASDHDIPVAAEGKYFKGKTITETDTQTAATGAYVKGAYNAAISAINKVAEDTATNLENYATKEGVVATIESASVKSVEGITMGAVAGVSAYTDWAEETTATLGGGTPTATLTYGRDNVVITRTAGDADTVANKYHATVASEEHPDVLASADDIPETTPYVTHQGVTQTTAVCGENQHWDTTSGACVNNEQ